MFLHIEKAKNVLHYPVFSQKDDLSYYCNYRCVDISTFFTITTKNLNTALNSIAEGQRYPASMVDKRVYIYIHIHSPATLLGTPVQLLGNTNC